MIMTAWSQGSWYDQYFNNTIHIANDVAVYWGSDDDACLIWSTGQTADALMLAVGADSNNLIIGTKANIITNAYDLGLAASTDPQLVITSATAWSSAGNKLKRGRIYHDGSNLNIISDTGSVIVNDELIVTTNIIPDASNTDSIGSTSYEFLNLYLGDGATSGLYLGTGQEAHLYYNSALILVGTLTASNAAGPAFADEAATTTNPTLIPDKAEMDTGWGWASDTLHAILGGASEYSFSASTLAMNANTITGAGSISANDAAGPIMVNEAATTTNPTLCPDRAEEDTGIGWASDTLHLVLGGASEYSFSTSTLAMGANTITGCGTITANDTAGPTIVNEAASTTNPTLCPDRAEDDTGIGWASDTLHFILGGTSYANLSTTLLTLAGDIALTGGGTIQNDTGDIVIDSAGAANIDMTSVSSILWAGIPGLKIDDATITDYKSATGVAGKPVYLRLQSALDSNLNGASLTITTGAKHGAGADGTITFDAGALWLYDQAHTADAGININSGLTIAATATLATGTALTSGLELATAAGPITIDAVTTIALESARLTSATAYTTDSATTYAHQITGSTITLDQARTGAHTFGILQTTVTAAGVLACTDAASLYVANAPTAGGSATITSAHSILVAAGVNTFRRDDIKTTPTDALVLENSTASDAVNTVQDSPAIRFRAHAWDTPTDLVDRYCDWRIYAVPASGATVSSTLYFQHSLAGAAYTSPMTLDSGGTVSISGLTVTNYVTCFGVRGATATTLVVQNRDFADTDSAIAAVSSTMTQGNGETIVGLHIQPTYNQTGSAAGTDLLVSRKETAVGTGNQYLADLGVCSTAADYTTHTSRWLVTNGGKMLGAVTQSIAAAGSEWNLAAGTTTITAGVTAIHGLQIDQMTVTAGSALTADAAASLYIANAPVAGGSAVVTAAYSIWVDAGNVRFDGSLGDTTNRVVKGWFTNLESTNDITINGAALATLYQPLDANLTSLAGLGHSVGDLIYADGAASYAALAAVAAGQVLVSAGVTTAPAWSSTLAITTVTVADGGAIQTGAADDDYVVLNARDNGTGYKEVARLTGAAEPYLSLVQAKFGTGALAADSAHRGMLYVTEGGAGAADVLYWVAKGADNNYTAIQVAIG